MKSPGTMADDVANDAAATAAASSSNPLLPYDRWTLRNPSTVPYGYFSGSNNRCNESFWASSSTSTTSTSSTSSRPSKTEKGFYITTAINYTNGPAHMGHAYEGTTADVIARFARLHHRGGGSGGISSIGGSGDTTDNSDAEGEGDVGTRPYFVTGADEHGEKIAKTAEGEGRAPVEICNKVCCVCACVCVCVSFVDLPCVYSLEIHAFLPAIAFLTNYIYI